MANTYTQLHIQLVFAVKYRLGLIQPSWKEDLHRYMTALLQAHDHKMLQINSMPDHIHIFIGLRPHEALSSLVQHVKAESTKWIKAKGFTAAFGWQDGFGAFSYSRSSVPAVINYIQNQEVHHQKEPFLKEYRRLLNAFEIEYKEEYLFKDPA
jgi:REP element-mobilizing transposase RayT